MNEQELINGIINGDRATIKVLYDRTLRISKSYVGRRHNNVGDFNADIYDVAHYAYLKFSKKILDNKLKKGYFDITLIRVVKDSWHTIFSKNNKRKTVEIPSNETYFDPYFSKILDDELLYCIEKLPTELQELIIKYYYEGYKVKELQEYFNISSESNVKQKLSKARKLILKYLKNLK